jgi:hypothetical protein
MTGLTGSHRFLTSRNRSAFVRSDFSGLSARRFYVRHREMNHVKPDRQTMPALSEAVLS